VRPGQVTVTKDNTKTLAAALRTLAQKQVLVGIPAKTTDRNDGEPINNATIGYIMENGSPAANIPARPHLKPGVRSVSAQVSARYGAAAKAAMNGDLSKIDQAHDVVGLMASSAVKRQILDGDLQPLSEATLARRRARGRTGANPLIDTGQYRNSITYVVRAKG